MFKKFRSRKHRFPAIIPILTCAFLLFACLGSNIAHGHALAANAIVGKVEVFDVAQGKIVATFPNSEEIQKEVQAWLHSISGMAAQAKIDPKHGIVLKIPVQPAIHVNNQWFKDDVVEVFIPVSPANLQKPLLLLFTSDNKPLMFHFTQDIRPFLDKYGISDLLKKGQSNKPYI
jgi:hypothetical protein